MSARELRGGGWKLEGRNDGQQAGKKPSSVFIHI